MATFWITWQTSDGKRSEFIEAASIDAAKLQAELREGPFRQEEQRRLLEARLWQTHNDPYRQCCQCPCHSQMRMMQMQSRLSGQMQRRDGLFNLGLFQ